MSFESIEQQFQGVENSPPANEAQKNSVRAIRLTGKNLAHIIDDSPLHPRYKAEALTNLETAIMFAVKGVFQPKPEGMR